MGDLSLHPRVQGRRPCFLSLVLGSVVVLGSPVLVVVRVVVLSFVVLVGVVALVVATAAVAGFLRAAVAVLEQARPLREDYSPGPRGGQTLPTPPSRPVWAAKTPIGA